MYPSCEGGLEVTSGHEFGDDVLPRFVVADADQLYNVGMVQAPVHAHDTHDTHTHTHHHTQYEFTRDLSRRATVVDDGWRWSTHLRSTISRSTYFLVCSTLRPSPTGNRCLIATGVPGGRSRRRSGSGRKEKTTMVVRASTSSSSARATGV